MLHITIYYYSVAKNIYILEKRGKPRDYSVKLQTGAREISGKKIFLPVNRVTFLKNRIRIHLISTLTSYRGWNCTPYEFRFNVIKTLLAMLILWVLLFAQSDFFDDFIFISKVKKYIRDHSIVTLTWFCLIAFEHSACSPFHRFT